MIWFDYVLIVSINVSSKVVNMSAKHTHWRYTIVHSCILQLRGSVVAVRRIRLIGIYFGNTRLFSFLLFCLQTCQSFFFWVPSKKKSSVNLWLTMWEQYPNNCQHCKLDFLDLDSYFSKHCLFDAIVCFIFCLFVCYIYIMVVYQFNLI